MNISLKCGSKRFKLVCVAAHLRCSQGEPWTVLSKLPRVLRKWASKGVEGTLRKFPEGKSSFRRLNSPVTHAHRLCLPLAIIQKDRPGSTCSFPPMVNEVPSQAIHVRVGFNKVALQAEHDSPPGILGRLKQEFIRPA